MVQELPKACNDHKRPAGDDSDEVHPTTMRIQMLEPSPAGRNNLSKLELP